MTCSAVHREDKGKIEKTCLYIFLDEGGNMDFSPSGTRYFVISSVARERPFVGQSRLSRTKYDFIEAGLNIEYFHASEDRQVVRNCVFDVVQQLLDSIRVDSLIVEKSKTGPALQPVECFYPRMMGYLLQYVVNGHDVDKYSEVIVVTDALPLERKRRAIEKAIKETLSRMLPPGTRFRCLHHSSKSSFELQIADYCNWAVFRKWESGDRRSFDLIQTGVKSEFDIFASGTRHYY